VSLARRVARLERVCGRRGHSLRTGPYPEKPVDAAWLAEFTAFYTAQTQDPSAAQRAVLATPNEEVASDAP
jgi:hypothetical protein